MDGEIDRELDAGMAEGMDGVMDDEMNGERCNDGLIAEESDRVMDGE